MFDPPVLRSMRELDRNAFRRDFPLAAMSVRDNRWISQCRSELGDSLLVLDRTSSIRPDPGEPDPKKAKRVVLLDPKIKFEDPSTWTEQVQKLLSQGRGQVVPFTLELNYSDWTYYEIMSAILPPHEQDELPSSFSSVGHVAHLNLRDAYLPYKHLIAQVLMDKNPHVTTVINKLDSIEPESQYRTFEYEVLAGDPSMGVEVHESNCIFRFDYSKVYWNSRLATEHQRVVDLFKSGEAVCDVMAGVGPFALPAGKKEVFVYANDLNPDCYASLQDNIRLNKVSKFVKPYNSDGKDFIKNATEALLDTDWKVKVYPKKPARSSADSSRVAADQPAPRTVSAPKTFSHYVMNLPATAVTFLGSFISLYHGREDLFFPNTEAHLPWIHVYCFSVKRDRLEDASVDICEEVSRYLEFIVTPEYETMDISLVRLVSPKKRMFRASFRLPAEVAFR